MVAMIYEIGVPREDREKRQNHVAIQNGHTFSMILNQT
jgi:hypothetical protein